LFLVRPAWSADSRDPPLRDGQQAASIEQVAAWLPRLVGKFRLEGSAEHAGESGPVKRESIRGQADCRSVAASSQVVGRAPGVECFLEMFWTPSAEAGGTPGQDTATPHSAVLLYGYELPVIGLRHMLVDDKGVAESGAGQLFNDTLVSASRCARIEGSCQRSVRITAGSDRRTVRMTMVMEADGKTAGSHELTLYREPVSP
jgi:hypothetical protein